MSECGRGFSDSGNTAVPTFNNNNYFNTKNLVSNDGGSSKFFDEKGTTLDPGYKDAANGDFTVTDATVKAAGAGDGRWL